MKVTISVGGKFHAFQLAKQLQTRGFLNRLITSYPKRKVCQNGIPAERVISLPLKELLQRIYNGWYVNNIFDQQASKYIRPCDIFVGWSSFSLQSLRKAKSQGAVTILERGSSHIQYQRDILKQEYESLGIKPCLAHPRLVEKELKEYQEADYISIPSGFVKRTFLEKGIPEDKLIQVPFGVDTEIFRPVLKRDNVFRVVYVGGMTIRKGVHYLLKAISELKLKNSELLLVGSINDEIKPYFQRYKDNFKYLGYINYSELYKYYSQGSLFAIASLEDGLALVIPQAMACGLPVICTTHSGGEDIVRNGVDGFVISNRNIAALKEKIIYFYENPHLCHQMGNEALNRVRDNFTWGHYGGSIVNAYLDLISTNAGTHPLGDESLPCEIRLEGEISQKENNI